MNVAPNLDNFGFCPFALITNKPCPACGGTRALVSLFNGDIPNAVQMNAVVSLAFIGVAVFAVGMLFFGRLNQMRTIVLASTITVKFNELIRTHWIISTALGLLWWAWNIQRW